MGGRDGEIAVLQFCLDVLFLETREFHLQQVVSAVIFDVCTHQRVVAATGRSGKERVVKKVVKYIESIISS